MKWGGGRAAVLNRIVGEGLRGTLSEGRDREMTREAILRL